MVTISVKTLEVIIKYLLYAVLFVTPLFFLNGLYFPFVAPKSYVLRLLVGIAFFFWIILVTQSKTHRPRFKNLLVISILVFLTGYVITGLLGVDIVRSFFSTTERSDGIIQFAVWVVYFLMTTSVFRVKRDWQIALGIFVLAGFLSSIFGLVKLDTQLRIFGTLGNTSFLGAFLLFAVGLAVLFLVKSFSPFPNPLKPKVWLPLLVLTAFFVVIIVMTQTRGDYIGLLAGLFTFAVLTHFFPDKSARFKKFVIILDVALIALFIFLGFVLTHPNSPVVAQFSLLQRIANSVESHSVSERLAEWGVALKGFRDKPIFGWGAENFLSVSNKYYDYRIGLIDAWFDRPHNQTLQILAEGGVTLFVGYTFVLVSIFIFLYRIFKKEPMIASVVGGTFMAYFAQDFFLFDTFATYIGFFTLLGFLYYLYEQYYSRVTNQQRQEQKIVTAVWGGREVAIYGITAVAVLAFIWYTVWIPYVSNPLVLQYNAAIDAGALSEADKILDTSFSVTSPYLAFDIKKGAGWELLIKELLDKEVKEEDKSPIISMYKKITTALADLVRERPYEPQIYFLLGSIYRIGYEQLGMQDDLEKSEAILWQAISLSPTRIEYVDAMSQVFLVQKKFDELDAFVRNFISQIDEDDSYRYLTLGNYHYLLGKLDLAFPQYVLAEEHGWTFVDTILDRDYDRYLQAAQETRNFEKAVAIIKLHLEKKGPDAANYFNLAVALAKLKRVDEAREAYQKALEIDPAGYKQYERFFE
ncbi:MAG TPA: O-antigen ligase family protein [Candidatus Paceibacterota bacterium]